MRSNDDPNSMAGWYHYSAKGRTRCIFLWPNRDRVPQLGNHGPFCSFQEAKQDAIDYHLRRSLKAEYEIKKIQLMRE